jgi:hypothetical protein
VRGANRRTRSRATSGPLRENIFNLGGGNKAPHVRFDKTIMRGGHRPVSRKDGHVSWCDQWQADSVCAPS